MIKRLILIIFTLTAINLFSKSTTNLINGDTIAVQKIQPIALEDINMQIEQTRELITEKSYNIKKSTIFALLKC